MSSVWQIKQGRNSDQRHLEHVDPDSRRPSVPTALLRPTAASGLVPGAVSVTPTQ